MNISSVDREEVKYCRDCYFSKNKSADATKWWCAAPKNRSGIRNIITGEFEYIALYAIVTRSLSHMCGLEAKWFLSHREGMDKLFPATERRAATSIKIGIDDL